jgi:hypothetical protein
MAIRYPGEENAAPIYTVPTVTSSRSRLSLITPFAAQPDHAPKVHFGLVGELGEQMTVRDPRTQHTAPVYTVPTVATVAPRFSPFAA